MDNVIQQSKKYAVLAIGILFAGCITQSTHAISYKADMKNRKVEFEVTQKDARIGLSSLCIAVAALQFGREAGKLNKLVVGTILAGLGTAGILGKEKTLLALDHLREMAIDGTETAVIYASDAFAYLSESASSAMESMTSEKEEETKTTNTQA